VLQKLLTLPEHLRSPHILVGFVLLEPCYMCMCCLLLFDIQVLITLCYLQMLHRVAIKVSSCKSNNTFDLSILYITIPPPSCVSCLIDAICVGLFIVVSNKYCGVLFFFVCCFLSYCAPRVASFVGLSILGCSFGIL